MKTTLKTFTLLLLVINNSGRAQQMVQTTKDVYQLKINEEQFVNKPLKNVLKELKPTIKAVYAINDNPFFFAFRFRTTEQQQKNEGSLEDRVSLYVYVKDPIDWQFENRSRGKEMVWTKEDAEKYGNLTVTRIKVIGPSRD